VSDQVSASSGAHRDVLLPSGELGHGVTFAGLCHAPPSFSLISSPVFNGERCRGIHPRFRPINGSRGHYPGVRRTHLSVTELPAAIRTCSPVEEVFPFTSADRGAPSFGKWPGCWAPSGWSHRTTRVGRIQHSGFALARGGFGFPLRD
jgi:hypothetical protein